MNSHFNLMFGLLLTISSLVSSLVAMPANAKVSNLQTIVVYGDSLSAAYGIKQDEGWVALLQQRIALKKLNYQVINASISGETTSGGLSRFANMLTAQKPNILLIALGGNDGLRGLKNNEIFNNLDAMIKQAKAQKVQVLLFEIKIPPNYGIQYSRQFSENYQVLAKKHSIKLLPFFLEGVAGNPKLIQADGLHPLAIAQPKILENVWPTVIKALKS